MLDAGGGKSIRSAARRCPKCGLVIACDRPAPRVAHTCRRLMSACMRAWSFASTPGGRRGENGVRYALQACWASHCVFQSELCNRPGREFSEPYGLHFLRHKAEEKVPDTLFSPRPVRPRTWYFMFPLEIQFLCVNPSIADISGRGGGISRPETTRRSGCACRDTRVCRCRLPWPERIPLRWAGSSWRA